MNSNLFCNLIKVKLITLFMIGLASCQLMQFKQKSMPSTNYKVSETQLTDSARGPAQVLQQNGTVYINDLSAYQKIFVISDIHGMYSNAVQLLKAAQIVDAQLNWSAANSILVIVGDSIDKGPQSVEVIDLWIKLKAQASQKGGLLIHSLGNHEAKFIASPNKKNKKAEEFIAELKAKNISPKEFVTPTSARGHFFLTQPLAVRLGNWVFAHSGFYPSTMTWAGFSSSAKEILLRQDYENEFILGENSILEAKKWELEDTHVRSILQRLDSEKIFGLVFGHQPNGFKAKNRIAAKYGGRLIKIDQGMAPEAGGNKGSLLVFPQPTQLLEAKYPSIQIINSEGRLSLLMPE